MIEVAWEKREVLKVMASDHLNTNKANFLIEDVGALKDVWR